MKVLNISSDYSKQLIYRSLAEHLQLNDGLSQTIYIPVRSEAEIGKHQIDDKNIETIYRCILTPRDRFLYHSKIKKVTKDLVAQVKVESHDLIHAHFLFSDGGVAFELSKRYQIPYVVAVRNTDINYFFKYALHLRAYGRSILKHASKIVLLSPAYKSQLLGYLKPSERAEIESKIVIIPNGVDPFWLDNLASPKLEVKDPLQFLYVGDFTSNKNIPFLIEGALKYFPEARLNIVGSKGEDEEKIETFAKKNEGVVLHGRISDKNELRQMYRESDILCVLSKRETFGVTYLEALSQGTPILYTKGQGVDGYFDQPVGESVEFGNEEDFKVAVERILKDFKNYSLNGLEAVSRFNWNTISNQYNNLYEQLRAKN